MALLFGANATDRVTAGDGASLQNLTAGTYVLWIYLTNDTTAQRYIQKGVLATNQRRMVDLIASSSGQFELQHARVTTALTARALKGSFASWGLNKWMFLASSFDIAGANGDQKLFCGDLDTVAAEPSAYSLQTVGAGALNDDSGSNQLIGGIATSPTLGRIAVAMIFNRVLTLAELHSIQFAPRVIDGCVGYWVFGGTTGTQADYSGNGNAGTVTTATVVDHVPLPPAFGTDWYSFEPPQVLERTLTGTQPSATGDVTRVTSALRALAGAQPAASGLLTRVHHRTRSLAGSQPTATGVLSRLYAALRALTGSAPTAIGALARVYAALRALAGNEPTATGALSAQSVLSRAVAGTQPNATGVLTRIKQALRSLTGAQPFATGALGRVLHALRTLAGAQPTATGTLTRIQQRTRSLTGAQPNSTGVLTRILQRVRSLAGTQPTSTGVLTGIAIRFRALDGAQPAASSTLTRGLAALRLLTGLSPNAAGTLVRSQQRIASMAGAQPAGTGVLSGGLATAPARGVLITHSLTDSALFVHTVSDDG